MRTVRDQDVDLGRAARQVARLWWVVLAGLVMGGSIGFVASVGQAQKYAAIATVYLGLPYGPGGDFALQSAQTNPSSLGQIVHAVAIDARVARRCKTAVGSFAGGISTQELAGTAGKNRQNAYVSLTVYSRIRRVASCAANGLARSAMAVLGRYASAKAAAFRLEIAQDGSGIRRAAAALSRTAPSNIEHLIIATRKFSLQADELRARSQLAQTEREEFPRLVAHARAARVTPRSPKTSAAVGALIGMIVAAVAILLWSNSPRRRLIGSGAESGGESSPSRGRALLLERLRRFLVSATLVALLVGTGAAFVVTERLKLQPSPILDTVVSKTLSPSCRCSSRSAHASFRLRYGGRVEVDVIRPSGQLVRRLARRRFRAGILSFEWLGQDSAHVTSPDGKYMIRVRLFSRHRTIVLPNVVRLDTVAPAIVSVGVDRSVIRPGQRVRVAYVLGEVAHPILLVDGRAVVVGRFPHRAGSLDWYGIVGGKPVSSGTHVLALEARDGAGNVSAPSGEVVVRVRALPHRHPRPRRRKG